LLPPRAAIPPCPPAASACTTASRAAPAASPTCCVTSPTLAESCSVAAATAPRFATLSRVPVAVACALLRVASLDSDIRTAEPRISSAARPSAVITPEIEAPKSCTCRSIATAWRSRALRSAADLRSCSRACASPTRSTSTEPAIRSSSAVARPISTCPLRSPPAIRSTVAASDSAGPETRRRTNHTSTSELASATTAISAASPASCALRSPVSVQYVAFICPAAPDSAAATPSTSLDRAKYASNETG
jgi:hypothetical protein